MKRLTFIFAALTLVFPLFGQEKSPPFKDQKDKFSYSIGLNIGTNLSKQNIPVNPDAITAV
jgi:Domain amino terminal to FKBP-type peptidyl-prolyl isomerase.